MLPPCSTGKKVAAAAAAAAVEVADAVDWAVVAAVVAGVTLLAMVEGWLHSYHWKGNREKDCREKCNHILLHCATRPAHTYFNALYCVLTGTVLLRSSKV